MTFITAIGSVSAADAIENVQRAESLGKTEDFVKNRLGFAQIRKSSSRETCSSMALMAIEELCLSEEELESIGLLILCTQNPDTDGIPHVSAVIQGSINLPQSCAAFDLGLGCSGFVYGCQIAAALMERAGIDKALVVTSDLYTKIVDESDVNTAMLFGDGAAASLLERDLGDSSRPGGYEILDCLMGTDGSRSAVLRKENGRLKMDGFGVFNAARQHVVPQIKSLLNKAKLEVDEISYFALHQGSKHIVDTLRKALGASEEAVPFIAGFTGNTVSSSVPMVLKQLLCRDGQRVVASGFGVGFSFATMLLKYEEGSNGTDN